MGNMLLGAIDLFGRVTASAFGAMCAFFAVMCIVGFCLIRTDKKRWNAQKARSDEMMARKKKPQAEDGAAEDAVDGKKKKEKKPKKKNEEPFEYEERVSEKALFIVAIFFGAAGELLAMLIYRHKWYKFSFRTYIPILTVINIIVAAVILYFLFMYRDPSQYINP